MQTSSNVWEILLACVLLGPGLAVAGVNPVQTVLTASDKAEDDNFGCSVSVDGDVALVGADWASVGATTSAGAAYVFERDQGGTNAWGEAVKLSASDKAQEDRFGFSSSVAGDVAVVGALYADHGGVTNAGAAYVFERDAGGSNAWGQVAKLTALDKAAEDWFGYSVRINGDVALVGAVYADPGGVTSAGAAYVFGRNEGGSNAWGHVVKLTASDKAAYDYFGYSVGVCGDVAVVGAEWASPGGITRAGAAYVFGKDVGGTNAWGEVAKLMASDKASNDYFGCSVSVAGDVVVIGARDASPDGLTNAGAAYVFERNAGGSNAWGQVAKLTASDAAAQNVFGYSASVAGDVVLVGSELADPGGVSDAGAAYLFEGFQYGPPTITNLFAEAGVCALSFDCQPAWRYDVQWGTNLIESAWEPAPALTNLPGDTSGSLTVRHTNDLPKAFYRLLRHGP